MRRRVATALLAGLGTALLASVNAVAAPSPRWSIESLAFPSNFSTADNATCVAENATFHHCDTYAVTATNVGSKSTSTGIVTLTDRLPTDVTEKRVELYLEDVPHHQAEDIAGIVSTETKKPLCSQSSTPITCVVPLGQLGLVLQPDQALKMYVTVLVDEPVAQGTLENSASVSGALSSIPSEASVTRLNTLEQGNPGFGIGLFDTAFLGVEGLTQDQAGSHPFEFETRIGMNTSVHENPQGETGATSVQDLRDAIVDLPPGVAGNATAASQCPIARLGSKGPPERIGEERQAKSGCPKNTILGHIRSAPESGVSALGPIYNLVPERGAAAELGFIDATGGTHVLYVSLAPTPEGYVLRTTSREIPQITLNEIVVGVFGDPAARDATEGIETPMFTNPESCTGKPRVTQIHVDSWQAPGSYNADGTPNLSDPRWASTDYESLPVTGCEALAGLFNPVLTAQPETVQADSSSGLEVNLKVPQQEGAEALSTPPVKDTVVTLPEGLTVNPSSADGLGACSEAQVGISPSGEPNAAAPECPDASKIGTVELETPALAMETCKQSNLPLGECPNAPEREKTPLHGSIYVARQLENPFGSLLAIYIVINDPRTGVVVKLPAKVEPNPVTGQLTTTVSNTPQFPFSELRTHFFGGSTAALRTPSTCGTFSVTSELTPWSAPESGPAATPLAPFEITQGPDGGACAHSAGEEPNSPSFQAGTVTPTAGAYSPLVVHMERADGSQNFGALNVTLPPGATGRLAGIPQCSDAQIAAAQARSNPGEGAVEVASPSCPASSQIGTVTVGAGAGSSPFYVTGKAYLAGPYKGAPFSMAIITPAVAGPFDLGVVVVRAGLYINPSTTQVTAKSDAIPSILQGIPLDVRSITVDVNRPGFTLNPTSCAPMTVTGEEVSTLGKTAPLSTRFQVGSCQGLKFAPAFTVSTAGRTSKAQGASLGVKVAYPAGALGSQANIARVDLQLPKQLPARLTTLQKACTEGQFDTNPADCPVASMIGIAKAVTPLLSSPLVGPAILVSHGGAAFPDVEFLLQGEGVEVVLDGKTQIKKGITYSHFETVPDAPIGTFETSFPEGPYSVLATNLPVSAKNSLCGQALTLPTTMTAQDGAVIAQTTKAAVTGCPKVKPKALTRAQQLAKALKACKRDGSKQKRAKCVKQARKRYGPQAKKKVKAKGKSKPKGGK